MGDKIWLEIPAPWGKLLREALKL